MAQDHVLVNDRLTSAADACVSVFDLGFMRGVGVFETLRTYAGGLPHAVSAHRERMWSAASELGIADMKTAEGIRADIARLYETCGYAELRVNLIITPGVIDDGLFNASVPTWVVVAKELKPYPEEHYQQGIKIVTFRGERFMPHLKTTNYLVGRQGYLEGQRHGASEAVYVNSAGHVTEGVTSNILIFKDGCFYEVAEGCLSGITKAGIRVVAEHAGYQWQKAHLSVDDVYQADACFITSSVRGIVPVVTVDDRTVGDGTVPDIACELRTAYHQFCIDEVKADAAACSGS